MEYVVFKNPEMSGLQDNTYIENIVGRDTSVQVPLLSDLTFFSMYTLAGLLAAHAVHGGSLVAVHTFCDV
jgi:hypothetical protein